MKQISIIIPHFNEWENLKELLDTIPKSSFIEPIVVDDCSNHQQKYFSVFKEKYPHIKFLKNDSGKKGAGSARNVGLNYATGKWLLFSDADDLFLNDFYNIILKFMKTNYDIVYFTPTSFHDNPNKVSRRHLLYKKYIKNYIKSKSVYDELRLRYLFVIPTSKLIRRKIVVDNNIQFEDVMYSNDILFSAKVGYYAKKILTSKKKIYTMRESTNSLTSVIDNERLKIRFYAWIDYVNFIKLKLTREDFLAINITAFPFVLKILKNKLGIKSLIKVIKESKKNNIPIIDRRLFNLQFMVNYFKKKDS